MVSPNTAVPSSDHRPLHEFFKELGDHYVSLGQWAQARECYVQASSLSPSHSGPYVGLGAVALEMGQIPAAIEAFERALAVEPDCADAFGGLALLYQQQENYPAALEMYLKCLQLDTDNMVALLGLFQTSCRMGTFSKITYYLEVYLYGHPDDVAVLFCLASLYAREGRYDQAQTSLRRVLALEPGKAEALELEAHVKAALQGSPS